ncbi:RNA polymerase sigma-70 factor [Actinoallomurus sp. NPDC050550]|uniref:RNA polymerase sigma-70 factor n=1 Tax=Actinoallomurus sp. NPDC050550 TaxID=3154937 RepID=UPI0033CEF2F4
MPDEPTSGDDVFEGHRTLLFSVAYRMLGSVAAAEDTLQEAWLRWSRVDRSTVTEPRAYLVKLTTRAAIDRLRREKAAREVYVGTWLPEPLLTAPDVAEEAALADSVSMAMLVVLETLSPLERSVFVLREAFGFDHAEIARVLDRSEESVRQLAHRARRHVEARRPRFEPDRQVRRRATERFLEAAVGGDLNALMEVLAPDVTLWSDGGGKVRAPRRPVEGADKVARFFAAVAGDVPPGSEFRLVEANGGPAVLVHLAGVPITVATVDIDPDGRGISAIHLIANPDKLPAIAQDTA